MCNRENLAYEYEYEYPNDGREECNHDVENTNAIQKERAERDSVATKDFVDDR